MFAFHVNVYKIIFTAQVHLETELETNLKLDAMVRKLAVLVVEEKVTTAFHSQLIYGLMSRVRLGLPLSSKNPKDLGLVRAVTIVISLYMQIQLRRKTSLFYVYIFKNSE